MELKIFNSTTEWEEAVLDRVLDVIAYDSNVLIGVAGGKTPISIYERLGFSVLDKSTWAKTHFVVIDERDVEYESKDSNYGVISRSMPGAHFLFFDRKFNDPLETAKNMDRNLRLYKQGKYIFDLLILGMGEDGHVASIFPGFSTEKFFNEKILAVRTKVPNNQFEDRYTLTFTALNSSKEVILLVKGSEKIRLLKAFKQGDYQLHDANEYPIINVLKTVPVTVFALDDKM
jgi:6-phosphogluconolactonase